MNDSDSNMFKWGVNSSKLDENTVFAPIKYNMQIKGSK